MNLSNKWELPIYLPIAIIAIIFFLYIFSQFGSRLLARQAFIWWIVSLFIITAILYPTFFQRFAAFLGVNLASNLVFAGLIFLLMFLSIEQSAARGKLLLLLPPSSSDFFVIFL